MKLLYDMKKKTNRYNFMQHHKRGRAFAIRLRTIRVPPIFYTYRARILFLVRPINTPRAYGLYTT